MLDTIQSGDCLDIARARGVQANPGEGFPGHTCYSPRGALGGDQTSDTDRFSEGRRFMPDFDLCAKVFSVEAGAFVDPGSCDGSAEQHFAFSGEGTNPPVLAPDMCFTLGTTLGTDTHSGRSDANQSKVLSPETCDAAQAPCQIWEVRNMRD